MPPILAGCTFRVIRTCTCTRMRSTHDSSHGLAARVPHEVSVNMLKHAIKLSETFAPLPLDTHANKLANLP